MRRSVWNSLFMGFISANCFSCGHTIIVGYIKDLHFYNPSSLHKASYLFYSFSFTGFEATLESCSALRTKIKVLCCLVSTLSASLITGRKSSSAAYLCQMTWQDLNLFTSCDHLTNLRIKLINSSAAAGLHVVMPVPLEGRYKEKRQHCICHEQKDLLH